jgi:hypothetical protein
MRKKSIAIVALLIFSLIFISAKVCFATVAPILWLSAEPGFYEGVNPNSWYTESWITGPDDFTLTIFNSSSHGNAVTAEDIYVVFAIKDITSQFSFTLDGNNYGLADFTNSGDHPVLDPHGIFGNHTLYMEYGIGDLASQASKNITIDVVSADPAIFHMDAYGRIWDSKKEEYYYARNPYSHDVTWDPPFYYNNIPEPASLLLLGLGVLGVGLIKKRRGVR